MVTFFKKFNQLLTTKTPNNHEKTPKILVFWRQKVSQGSSSELICGNEAGPAYEQMVKKAKWELLVFFLNHD